MRSLAFATLVLIACDVPTVSERAPISGPHRAPDRLPPASIHGARIQLVAVTEQADAAISVDALGEVRFWPSLDGNREPVQLAIPAPARVAIAHASDGELLAAAVDHAGNGALFRISADGVIRSTTPLPGELAIVQLAAIDDGVLVVRADQTIERFGEHGERLGRIVGDSGERFTTLAVRHGGAAVLSVAGPAKTFTSQLTDTTQPLATHVRFIVIGDRLAPEGQLVWGARRALPANIDADALALSPDHHRIAVIDVGTQQLRVLDAADLHEIGKPILLGAVQTPTVGFVDKDDVADIDGDEVSWWPEPSPAQLTVTFGASSRRTSDVAFGDGVAVSATQASLVLVASTAPHLPRYLGWIDDATGELANAGSGFALALAGGDAVVLDAALAPRNHVPLDPFVRQRQVWLDENHVVLVRSPSDRYDIVLVDVSASKAPEVVLGNTAQVAVLFYEPHSREVAFYDDATLHRVALDASFSKATALPDLALPMYVNPIQLLDPKTHDGLVAAAAYSISGQTTLLEWHDGPGPKLEPIVSEPVMGMLVALGKDGASYLVVDDKLVVRRAKGQSDLGPGSWPMMAQPSDDGTSIAVLANNMLEMRDGNGHALWRRPIWDAMRIVFTPDGRHVVVSTRGGLIDLDARTGERIVVSCGYDFGLHDDAPRAMPNNVAPACED